MKPESHNEIDDSGFDDFGKIIAFLIVALMLTVAGLTYVVLA